MCVCVFEMLKVLSDVWDENVCVSSSPPSHPDRTSAVLTGAVLDAGLCCDSASRTTSPESQTSGGTRTTNSHKNDRASRRRARRRGETLPSSVAIETVRTPEDTWQKCAEVLFVVCLSCVSLMAAFRTHFNVYCCICFFYCEQMLKCPFQHRNDP